MNKSAIAYTDGSGNSGRIQACAAILYVDTWKFQVVKLLPPHTTNNVGEYNGVLLAVKLAKEHEIEHLLIRSDSKLIVNHIRGLWDCRDERLLKLRNQIWHEAESFLNIQIEWIPREENAEADRLCRQAIQKALSEAKAKLEAQV